MNCKEGVLNIEDIHLIRLTRNAWNGPGVSTDAKDNASGNASVSPIYLTLDYFDQLCYSRYETIFKEDKKIRLNAYFLGAKDPFKVETMAHPPLTMLVQTLVEIKFPDYEPTNLGSAESPFDNSREEPFLSLINITKVPSPEFSESQFPYEYLKNIYKKITEAITEAIRERQCKVKVLYSMNSGCFVAVVRSNAIDAAYNIAMGIRAINYDTFTIASIECNECDLSKATPSQITHDLQELGYANSQTRFAVRLLVKSLDKINEIKDLRTLGDSTVNTSIGLYGRYDCTFILSYDDFSHLCPYIYQYKLTKTPILPTHAILPPIVEKLVELLSAGDIYLINVRPLVTPSAPNIKGDKGDKGDKGTGYRDAVKLYEDKLKKMLDLIRAHRYVLPYYNSEYKEALSLLNEVLETFSGVRYENDSTLNGFMFFFQMHSALDSLDVYRKHFKDTPPSPGHCKKIVAWLRRVIVCLNSFTKLVQSVNLQSIQTPNFEMQTRVDMEKYAVAYTEFLRQFTSAYHNRYNTSKDPRYPLYPMLTTDPSQQEISAATLFPHSFPEDDQSAPSLVTVLIPSVEYFLTLYDTLPLICHEISHDFRFVSRPERNNKLASIVFEKVASDLTGHLFKDYTSLLPLPIHSGIAGTIHDALLASFEKEFKERPDKELEERSLDFSLFSAASELSAFILRKLSDGERKPPDIVKQIHKTLKEALKRLYQFNDEAIKKLSDDSLNIIKSLPAWVECEKRRRDSKIITNKVVIDALDKCLGDLRKNLNASLFTELMKALQVGLPTKTFDDVCALVKELINGINSGAADLLYNTLLAQHEKTLYYIVEIFRPEDTDSKCESCRSQTCKEKPNGILQGDSARYLNCLLLSSSQKSDVSAIDEQLGGILARYLDCMLLLFSCRRDILDIRRGDSSYNYEPSENQEPFVKELHKHMYEKAKELYKSSFLNSEISSAAILKTGILADYEIFLMSFKNNVDLSNIDIMVKDLLHLYKEVFADLCMCAAIGFDAFGYCRFFAKHYIQVDTLVLANTEKNMFLIRARIVAWVLADKAGQTGKEFAQELICRKKKYIASAIEKICEEIPFIDRETEPKSYTEILCNDEGLAPYQVFAKVDKIWEDWLKRGVIPEPEQITSEFAQSSHEPNRFLEYLKQIATISVLVDDICSEAGSYKKIIEHASELHREHIASDGSGCKWETGLNYQDIQLRKAIAEYFNNNEFRSLEDDDSDEIFKNNLKFALHFYNQNRAAFERIINPTQIVPRGDSIIEDWRKNIMNGRCD